MRIDFLQTMQRYLLLTPHFGWGWFRGMMVVVVMMMMMRMRMRMRQEPVRDAGKRCRAAITFEHCRAV